MATTEEGYDVEVLQEISSDLCCVICLKLMRNPVQFKCGHGMCYGCFRNLLQKAKQKNGETQCPQCREIVRENQVISNVMLHRLILSMQVQCSNEHHGCVWIGTLSELDNHLMICKKNVQRKKSPSKQQRKVISLVPDTANGNLLLNIVDSLTLLHDKVDDIDCKLLCDSPVDNLDYNDVDDDDDDDDDDNQDVKNDLKNDKVRKRRRSELAEPSSAPAKAFQKVWQAHDNVDLSKYIAFLMVVLLLLIYFVTALAFSSFERFSENSVSDGETLQQTEAFLSHNCQRCGGNNEISSCDSDIRGRIDELLSRFDHQFESFFELISYGMKYHVFDLRMSEKQILEEIPNFYVLQNRTISELEKRFSYSMEQSRIEINTNISHYDTRSLNTLSVDNVESLLAMAEPIFNTLSKRIFEEINFAEFHAFRSAEKVYNMVRTNLWSIRQKSDFGARAVFLVGNLYSDKLGWYSKMLAELRDNVTRSYISVDRDKFLTVVSHDFVSLKLKYEYTLKSYLQNITRVLTQEQRFNNLVHRVQDVDLLNGRFVWKLNATKMATAHNSTTFKSRRFQTGSSGRGMLFLYKDKSRAGYFKLTFVQFLSHPITISLSVMSQKRPEVLLCFETSIGRAPRKTPAEVVKHFTIPMNMTEMEDKGFMKDDQIFVRCLTEDKRI